MIIASWNVNSIRARLSNVIMWLEKTQPDVLLLQEIKCMEEAFPAFEFQSLGYECHVVGQKSYNGVALLTKHKASDIMTTLSGDENDTQARYVQATIKGYKIAGLYLPNGNPVNTEKFPYKLSWMDRLYKHVKSQFKDEKPFILGGDYNVIPTEIDVHNPKAWENDALFHPETLKRWRKILGLGMTEAYRSLHPHEEEAYTFWDYQAGAWQQNQGLRIDHFLLSPEAADKLKSCTIDKTPRGEEKASDHTPILVEIQ